jgi:hypothetical protein
MEVTEMEKGDISEEAGEEVVMEEMDCAKLKNKVMKSKKRLGGETRPECSSEEEPMAKFNIVRSLKNIRNPQTMAYSRVVI